MNMKDNEDLDYKDITLTAEDVSFFDECGSKINLRHNHGQWSKSLSYELSRFLYYLVYLELRRDSEWPMTLTRSRLEGMRNDPLRLSFYNEWTRIIENSDFQRLYEDSEEMQEMRRNSPIPVASIIGNLVRGKAIKYMRTRCLGESKSI